MDRKQLKSSGIAAAGYGNALFLDEGDEVKANAVVFTPLDGAWTVFATDETAAPIETTRRSFASDSEAFDYMHQCLREQMTARRARRTAQVEAEAARPRPSLFEAYRTMGLTGVLMVVAWIATAIGWLWISPFTYSRADTFRIGVSTDQQGEFIFDAQSGIRVVAVCYSLAVVNMAEQWSLGRHDGGRLARRAIGTAAGTALFSAIALICMVIRSDEIENLLYWIPPTLALFSGIAVALGLAARSPGAQRDEPSA
ncbi:hypothetical protein [Aeromicrobium sp. UC242_57]|uniref:hypothetical protein n=1 Tax=Aeromicrobium sp. UC242_57 TaxID=3374624 RepID=UPI0037B30EB8